MIGNNFPYTDFHGLNLDWIIGKVKEIDDKVNDAFYDNVRTVLSNALIASNYDAGTETLTLTITLPEE